MAGPRGRRLLVASGAIVIASAVGGNAQQERETQREVVEPEVRREAPPLIVGPADEPEAQNPEQLMTSLRRAEEALQLNDRNAAMQALIQAEEQLDELAGGDLETPPWLRFDLALQDAMKALAEDNPEYALTALQRVTAPAEGSAAAPAQAGAEQGEQQPDAVLGAMPASDVIGTEVVDPGGEKIAEISDIVRGRDDGALYAILDVGGFLGMGNKKVALALDRFEVAEDDTIVQPQATESRLEEMPIYDQDQYERIR